MNNDEPARSCYSCTHQLVCIGFSYIIKQLPAAMPPNALTGGEYYKDLPDALGNNCREYSPLIKIAK